MERRSFVQTVADLLYMSRRDQQVIVIASVIGVLLIAIFGSLFGGNATVDIGQTHIPSRMADDLKVSVGSATIDEIRAEIDKTAVDVNTALWSEWREMPTEKRFQACVKSIRAFDRDMGSDEVHLRARHMAEESVGFSPHPKMTIVNAVRMLVTIQNQVIGIPQDKETIHRRWGSKKESL